MHTLLYVYKDNFPNLLFRILLLHYFKLAPDDFTVQISIHSFINDTHSFPGIFELVM